MGVEFVTEELVECMGCNLDTRVCSQQGCCTGSSSRRVETLCRVSCISKVPVRALSVGFASESEGLRWFDSRVEVAMPADTQVLPVTH